MVVGYNDKIDNIVIIDNDNKRIKRKLLIYGLNRLGNNFSYYNSNDGYLHIINMDYVKKIKLYSNKLLVMEITKTGIYYV